jgi:cytochrome c peroxidase
MGVSVQIVWVARHSLALWFCGSAAAGLALLLVGCGGSSSETQLAGSADAPLSEMAQIGELIFNDTSLSASGRLACASCHDPAHAFAAPDGASVPLGGPAMDQANARNAPSIKYLAFNPKFAFDSAAAPSGGFDRDGRAASVAEQARGPLLSPIEMANVSAASVADKLSRASYGARFRAYFGADIFADPEQAMARALLALQQYELADREEFAPFSSKYDAVLAGSASLSTPELRGLALFNDPARGNCAACHPSARNADGTPPMFTDYSYDNLGVPRNPAILANADPAYFDLGLCGPLRTDLVDTRPDLCGAFKVPSLRNVALTAPYFHNGRFQTLREALGFYVRRDTNPEEWYPVAGDGLVYKFDDLPSAYIVNVNTTEVPYNRRLGDQPALTPAQIDDLIAFLQTLTDGYQP